MRLWFQLLVMLTVSLEMTGAPAADTSLLAHSPFLPAGYHAADQKKTPPPVPQAPAQPLPNIALRGVMVFSGECYVSLYNLELDKAQWCRIGEDVFGGKVTGYDTEMGVVSYAHGGRTYQYALADDLDERAQLIAESRQPRFGSDGRAVEKRAYSSMPIGQQIHYNDPRFKERLLQQNIELPANWGTPGFQQDLIDQRDQLREESKSQALAAKDRRASNGSGSKRIFPISPVNSGLSVPQKEVRAAINGGAK